ncbi:polyphosphate:AMP phosphotransferase [Chitinimonas sp. BJB300]|uniref:polyphosphate:AMP phosphotransferase n=1 Tax=Chitinimonas sp. BJB300 TaxID=1559339 RepID=UPI000C0FF997|nr:polyphosphate:AMP phosphotransferase [Chitinimonas sp. BJB300]PHV11395.1 polyphosphate:AMP phosphotransferase [Chitinimonas sp. BJB300]TSJ90993.1 polyphosphate:AMP phosphotransferase [Chitinimonas sp. BJB300]
MFEAAELGHQISKGDYKAQVPGLREALLDAQYELQAVARFPVLILINGLDGAGKGETVNLLNEWMDPRLIDTHAFGNISGDEKEYPPMWRYWRALPAKGRIGILFGSWYSEPVFTQFKEEVDTAALHSRLDEIIRLETMLAEEGILLLKFWFHLGKKAQKVRLTALEKDPRTRWRVGEREWMHLKHYDTFRKLAETVLMRTSTGVAPWMVVDGEDERYRNLTVGKQLLESLRQRLAQAMPQPTTTRSAPLLAPLDGLRVLDRLILNQSMSKSDYTEQLEVLQGRLNALSRHPKLHKHSIVLVFEGNDAAGKGGAIRRVTGALDARHYHVHPIAAPSEDELAQPYLWRFWRRLPRRGRFAIFDRSWYGRVLVERVEGFADEANWMRAYSEINDFEQQLHDANVIVVKFWLAIDADEQLKRFQAREETGFKRFKITDDDWRNREKWPAYREAVHDMVERTSTPAAPWLLVEANNKYYARIKVLRCVCEAIEAQLR